MNTNDPGHTGSWNLFGIPLPDYQITETIGGLLGLDPSNVVPDQYQNPITAYLNKTQSLQSVSTSTKETPIGTRDGGNVWNGSAWVYSPLGGSTGGTTGGTTQTIQQPTQTEDQLRAQIDSIYNPNSEYLAGVESNLNTAYPQTQQAIEGQYGTAKNTLDLNNTQTQNALLTAENQAGGRKEDALTAARRLYQELTMAGRQRFGGSSSAGEAYGALTAVEQQRGAGQIQRDFGTTMASISTKRSEIAQNFQNTLYTLEQEKTNALNQARQAFDDKMLEITRLRASNQAAKSSAYIEALQQLKSQIFAINQSNTQFTTQLQQQQAAYNQQLDLVTAYNAAQQDAANKAVTNYSTQTTTNPVTSMNIYDPNQAGAYSPTGAVKKRDEFNYSLFA